MTPLHIGLDLDGVFANFNDHPDKGGMAALLIETSGRNLFPKDWKGPDTWHWWGALGYKKSEADVAWEAIRTRADFWLALNPYPDTAWALHRLSTLVSTRGVRYTFLTTRPGTSAHWQSVRWLRLHGMPEPQVIICPSSESKGVLAKALGLDAYVDDYPPNIEAVWRFSPDTAARLYAQPWNKDAQVEGATIYSLGALVEWITALARTGIELGSSHTSSPTDPPRAGASQ